MIPELHFSQVTLAYPEEKGSRMILPEEGYNRVGWAENDSI